MKKLLLITIIILAGYNLSYCQEKADSNKKSKFTEVGLFATPTSTYFNYTQHDTASWSTNPVLDQEIPKIGWQLGLNTNYKVSKRFSLQATLSYTNHGSRTGKISATYSTFDPIPDDPIYEFEGFNSHKYIDLGIGARYSIIPSKLHITIIGEGNYHIETSTKSVGTRASGEREVNKSKVSSNDVPFYDFRYSLGGMLEYTFPLNRKLYYSAQVRYKQMMGKIADTPSQIYPYSIGIGLGVYYKL